MIVAAILGLAGSASAPLTADQFLVSTQTCVAVVGAKGLDEAGLAGDGWIRVTTDAEESAKPIRTYGRRGAVPIYLTLKRGGCVAQTGRLPDDGLSALLSKAEGAFGKPKFAVGSFRQWQIGNHSILFSDAGGQVGFAVSYVSGASK